MVDESGQITTLGRVHNSILVNAKHVAATNTLGIVPRLSQISHTLANHFAHILDHKLFTCDMLDRKQTPVMDVGPCELQGLFAQLGQQRTRYYYMLYITVDSRKSGLWGIVEKIFSGLSFPINSPIKCKRYFLSGLGTFLNFLVEIFFSPKKKFFLKICRFIQQNKR